MISRRCYVRDFGKSPPRLYVFGIRASTLALAAFALSLGGIAWMAAEQSFSLIEGTRHD